MDSAAFASPLKNKQAEFRKIQREVDAIDQRLDVTVEQYNSATVKLNKTKKEVATINAKLKATQQKMAARQAMINKRFNFVYRKGGLSDLQVLISTKTIQQFLYYLELVERQNDKDAGIMAQLKAYKRDIDAQQALLKAKADRQRAIVADIRAKKNKIARELKGRNALLSRVKKDLARYRLAEMREQARLRRAYLHKFQRVARAYSSRGESRGGAVGVALGQLGKPYIWAAEGPGSFDCSGLTRYVYEQLGVELPHSSEAQYSAGQHVSMDDLQPGDLVFFEHGGTIGHVGIYIGGGNFIHAPHTGDVVKISRLDEHGGYVGAVRP